VNEEDQKSSMSGATKRLVYAGVGLAVLGMLQYQFNIIPIKASKQSEVPTAVELPTEAPQTIKTEVDQAGLPSSTVSTKTGTPVRTNVWAWNAQFGLMFANGGPKTTKDSLMEKYGVKLTLTRQDDTSKSQAEQIKFATKLANGDPNPAEGVHFVIIMGDGAAQYLAGINKALTKLGPDYKAEIVGAVGYSGNDVSGEDTFMGPSDWKDDPTKAKGGLVSGVLRDGDWNIAQYWLQQNGIKNNPDETTWDPDALNWVASDDYIKAAEQYITGYCEDRRVVRDGKYTNESKKHVCVQGTVTWTPGDVNVAKKKGGLVKLLSTKENRYQMPSVVIGVHKWNQDHAKVVQGFLQATFEGSDQVRNYDKALAKAGAISQAVYGEETPAYWVRYYKGAVERDRTGIPVPLGGSRVANLGDNLVLFGLADGSGDATSSMFRATYEGFGNIAKQQYPKLVPEFPSVTDAVNLSFIQALAQNAKVVSKPEEAKYDDTPGTISDVVAARNWLITFESGKATFTKDALKTLDELFNVLSVNNLSIQIDGHTDNTGNPQGNIALSQARADAVRAYLTSKAPSLFPSGRIVTQGFGDTKPVASNSTADGKAQNRRVTITIGNK
jgi:OOP family OmpA-OmpF porin